MHPRKGKLLFSDTRVSGNTGTVEAEAEVPNPDGVLKPGQFVRVRLTGATRPKAMLVPSRAVLEGPQGKFVYVVADGKARPSRCRWVTRSATTGSSTRASPRVIR